MPARDSRPQTTYFIQHGEDGPIKIGITTNVQKRMVGLATGCADGLTLLATLDGDFEQALHLRLSVYRRRGEWFEPAPAVLAEVEAAKAKTAARIEQARVMAKRAARPRGRWIPTKLPPPPSEAAYSVMKSVMRNSLRGRRTA